MKINTFCNNYPFLPSVFAKEILVFVVMMMTVTMIVSIGVVI